MPEPTEAELMLALELCNDGGCGGNPEICASCQRIARALAEPRRRLLRLARASQRFAVKISNPPMGGTVAQQAAADQWASEVTAALEFLGENE